MIRISKSQTRNCLGKITATEWRTKQTEDFNILTVGLDDLRGLHQS